MKLRQMISQMTTAGKEVWSIRTGLEKVLIVAVSVLLLINIYMALVPTCS